MLVSPTAFTLADNTLLQWGMALLLATGVTGALRLIQAVAAKRLGKLAAGTDNIIDDAIVDALRATKGLFLLVAGLAAGAQLLELPPTAARVLTRVALLTLILQGGLWAIALATGWLHRYRDQKLEADRGAATSIGALVFLSRLVIGSLTLLIVLDNVGIDVTALITGLGIGGVAVALALQSVLGDLFASLSIVLDKPFIVGDFLIIGDHMGAVENVGLKTTRIRSLSGEQLVFSNSDLLGSRIRNFGRMAERRVIFKLGVTYDTALDKLKKIPELIREAIAASEQTRFDRSHFASYGDFALQFESVYYVLAADYNVYMDIQQAINLRLRERFEAEGIEFAFPTQTLFVRGPDATPGACLAPQT